jgi:hypothetical protein
MQIFMFSDGLDLFNKLPSPITVGASHRSPAGVPNSSSGTATLQMPSTLLTTGSSWDQALEVLVVPEQWVCLQLLLLLLLLCRGVSGLAFSEDG